MLGLLVAVGDLLRRQLEGGSDVALAGVTELETAELGPVPTALTAATVKLYAVPLLSPVTVSLVTSPTLTAEPFEGLMT